MEHIVGQFFYYPEYSLFYAFLDFGDSKLCRNRLLFVYFLI